MASTMSEVGRTDREERLLSMSEAGELLGLSLRKMQQLAADGRLRVVHFDRAVRVHPEDLRAFVEECREASPR